MKKNFLILGLVVLVSPLGLAAADLTLWYPQPATNWMTQALPIGNGQMGAMIFGGITREHIQFNEESLWIGDEQDTGAYQAFGDVFVEFNHADGTNYHRELDLQRAVHTMTYESNGVKFRREAFASNPAKVIVIRFTADKPGALTGAVSLTDMHAGKIMAKKNQLTSSGWLRGYTYKGGSAKKNQPPYAIALHYEAQVAVLNDGGTISVAGKKISFKNANSVTLLLAAGTDFIQDRTRGWRGELPHKKVSAHIAAAAARGWSDLLAEHLLDYTNLFDRVKIDLGHSSNSALPTDARLMQTQKPSAPDPELEALLFQYGRYLMISSSRPGGLPANLQGKWNNENYPPWRCDYHTDINVEMNYWLPDVANLSECFEPYARWIDSIRAVRTEATRKTFGKRGWLMRGESGLFGGSTWEWVPGASAWLLQNSFDHYRFTGDRYYLRRYAYPAMKEVCEYWIDSLHAQPDGTLITPKGLSPEHGPVEPGISFDQQQVWDLFTSTIEAAAALGVDAEFRARLADQRAHLLAPKIGRWGQLQEWMKDIDDPNDHHRHQSHLVALHPGRQISPLTTPELAKAAAVSLNARGDESTGWGAVWKMSLWARLFDGDRAHKLSTYLIRPCHSEKEGNNGGGLYPNLLDACPPFQIDGNFGYPAAVCEMLLQSHETEIHLLPALPAAWPTGKISGLRARGGYEVGEEWKDGKLVAATIKNISGSEKIPVRYGDQRIELSLKPGETRTLDSALGRIAK
jgi:alpha-L-fucosidase 2